MCLPVNKKRGCQEQQQQAGGGDGEDAAAKTYEDLQTTLNLLEVMICLNIRRYLQTDHRGPDDGDTADFPEEGGWIGSDCLAMLANCPEFQVPYFSPPGEGADDDEGEDYD